VNSSKKIVLVGHFGVGKSSLVRRFVQNSFSDNYIVTIGVHILKKEVAVENHNLSMVIWDIEGKDDIKKVRPSYLLGTSGFIYVIDPTRPQTFEDFNAEIQYLKDNYPKTAIITLCNKTDLVNVAEMKSLFKEKGFEVDFFASAKTGNEVENAFRILAEKIV